MYRVVINFIITRDYDERNNKIVERTFQVMKKKNELFEEVLYKYDAKNNLVVTTDKVEDVISEINQYKCNSENQKIEEIRIRKKFEEHPWDGNLDSAVAHRNDKELTL